MAITLGRDPNGFLRRIGESHPRAKFTDGEIELMRQLHDDGLTLRAIAEKFECSFSYVGEVCRHMARNLTIEEKR